MSDHRIGIRGIAKLAGVSVATVSRVINSPDKVSPATLDSVNHIINKYNYIPNLNARNLYAKESNSFALFVYDLENPFFIALVKELNKIAFKHKRTLLICDTENNADKEREYFLYCQGIRTRGIIVTEGYINTVFYSESNQRIAILDRHDGIKGSCVRSNHRAGIFSAVDYLYNLNHRKFAFAGYTSNFYSVAERRAAFIEALDARDIPINDNYIFEGSMTCQTGKKALDYFCSLSSPPTAIVCANDQVALGVFMRAQQIGIRIAEDLSIIGFDGCLPDYLNTKITTIRQDIPRIAAELFECIFSEDSTPHDSIVDVSLEVGDSCARIPSM